MTSSTTSRSLWRSSNRFLAGLASGFVVLTMLSSQVLAAAPSSKSATKALSKSAGKKPAEATPVPSPTPTPEVHFEASDRVVMQVNFEPVTMSDLRGALRQLPPGTTMTTVIERELDRRLLLQAAKDVPKEAAPPEEVEAEVEMSVERLRFVYGGASNLRAKLRAEGSSMDELREDLKVRLAEDMRVGELVQRKMRRSDRATTAVGAWRLFRFALRGKPTDAAVRDRLVENLRASAEAGMTFAALARDKSEVLGAQQDQGYMGWVRATELDPHIVEALHGIKPGGVTEPVYAGGYWNIFYVEGMRDGASESRIQALSAARDSLLKSLRKRAILSVFDPQIQAALPMTYRGRVESRTRP